MRIISGKFKSRLMSMPKLIRPTSNKVREALFEIIKARLEGAVFLDLYCGSGLIGIEALSRGAGQAIFVDNDFKSISAVKANLKSLGLLEQYSMNIYNEDAIQSLRLFEKRGIYFDIVFLDPPYYGDIAKNTLIEISDCDILTPRNAIVIAEIYKKEVLPETIGTLKKIRTSKYGDTKLEFYEKNSYIPG